MPLSKRDETLIEKALQSSLSDDEQVYFNARMGDPGFKDAFEAQRLLHDVIEDDGSERQRDELTQLDAHMVRKHQLGRNWTGSWWIFLALAVVSAIIFYAINSNKADPQEIFATYFELYPNTIDPLANAASDDRRVSMFQMYEMERYDPVIRQMPENGSEDQRWYLAQAHLGKGNMVEARSIMLSFSENRQSKYFLAANWYVGLSYLKEEKRASATQFFEVLNNAVPNPYQDRAASILKEIK